MGKINLKQLTALFANSAGNEELPTPIRQFAAQLTILTAHVERIETKLNTGMAHMVTQDKQIAELAEFIVASRPGGTPSNASTPAESPTVVDEDEEAKAMAEQVLRETEAEVAAAAKAPIEKPTAAITPLRQPNVNGNKAPSKEAS